MHFIVASQDYSKNFSNYLSEAKKTSSSWKTFLKKTKLDDYEFKNKVNLDLTTKLFNQFTKNSLNLLQKRNNHFEMKIKKFNEEFLQLIKALKTKNLGLIRNKILKFSYLFKGYNGVPSNYIVGYKEK